MVTTAPKATAPTTPAPAPAELVRIPAELLAPAISQVALPTTISKRDGRLVDFEMGRIRRAIERCFAAIDREPYNTTIDELTLRVVNAISAAFTTLSDPTVERVQDIVELTLYGAGEFEAAKSYILYRAERTRLRLDVVTSTIQAAFDAASQYFPTPLQQFQYYDKYARWSSDSGRRETWPETVERTVSFLGELIVTNKGQAFYDANQYKIDSILYEIRQAILGMQAMPSMRMLAMAGPAARRQNMAIYNCAFMPVDDLKAFSEALLISMAGCGVGFSVERRHINKLPHIPYQNPTSLGDIKVLNELTHVVEDTTEGWGRAVDIGMKHWFNGTDVRFDYSLVRPAGTPLTIKGGRASGPAPLQNALEFARARVLARQGGRLSSLDAHDIMCQIGNAAVSGGVRRTAMISLFDIDDTEMLECKIGDFEHNNSQRWNANNSAVVPESGITQSQFLEMFSAMVRSGRGEPGIVSREAMRGTIPSRRKWHPDMGTNPCGEIVLRPHEFCNLTIVVARHDDTLSSLKAKARIATLIGTIQSLATDFPGMRPEWSNNCQAERLLGVDITGQRDCIGLLTNPRWFTTLRHVVINTNREFAAFLGIPQSAATTTVKPSGNSAVLLNSSSGIHTRWAPYYKRNVRVAASSPIYKVMRDAGVPMEPENGQETDPNPNTYVATFPMASPPLTRTRNDVSAIEQCEWWLANKTKWTEHNPSVTIYFLPNEIVPLLTWLWDHISLIGGMAFLPRDDTPYAKLPNIEIDATEYIKLHSTFPSINWANIVKYEQTDNTTASQERACLGDKCDTDT